LIVVTHEASLIAALKEQSGCHSIVLEKTFGETSVAGANNLNAPRWQWPTR
jgi:predicted ATPase